MPTVQPRLPLLFEPAAGISRSVAALQEQEMLAAPEPAERLPAVAPARRPLPAAALPALQDALPKVEPLPPPMRAAEGVRPSPPLATDPTREIIYIARNATPVHESSQPPLDLTAPRRGVPVEIRPAVVPTTTHPPTASPPPSAGSRRGSVAAPRNSTTHPERTDGPNGDLPRPPTVHVHIGRVDVRAIMPPAVPARPAAHPTAPRPTLEDYLSGRKEGSQP